MKKLAPTSWYGNSGTPLPELEEDDWVVVELALAVADEVVDEDVELVLVGELMEVEEDDGALVVVVDMLMSEITETVPLPEFAENTSPFPES